MDSSWIGSDNRSGVIYAPPSRRANGGAEGRDRPLAKRPGGGLSDQPVTRPTQEAVALFTFCSVHCHAKPMCNDALMGDVDAAQAAELIRALVDAIYQMTHRLTWFETREDSQARGVRLEAAALRRDIYEARRHIDRLERRYLNIERPSIPMTVRAVATFRA